MLDYPDSDEPPPVYCDSVEGVYKEAAIVSNTEYSSSVGRELLRRGGSAADALVGTLLCEGLCGMQSLGLGGGGFMVLYRKEDRRAYCLNARERAPAAATKHMFKGDPHSSATGRLSVAVPGELMGYWEAHQRFGRLPWREVLRPAVRMCLEGVPVNHRLGRALSGAGMAGEIRASPTLRKVLGVSAAGPLPAMGDRLRLPILARTLQVVADSPRGAWELYDGKLTAGFARDLKAVGSIITKKDLNSYRAEWVEPASCELGGGLRVFTVPPPASGQILLLILRLLDGEVGTDPAENLLRLTEAFKYAFAVRTRLGDPSFEDNRQVLENLKSSSFIGEIKAEIRGVRKTNGDPGFYGAQYDPGKGKGGTANVIVRAPNGDVAVATSTINTMFGSLLASESTGIILNNQMDDFSSPNIVNSFDLAPCPANCVSPGKRPLSSACPTVIVDRDGEPRLAVGAAGGSHITTSTAQVIMNYLWFNLSLKKAVDMPRIHHQLLPMKLTYEDGIKQEVLRKAEEAGHKLKMKRPSSSVTAIAKDKGVITAIYDYRRGGSTDGY